MAVNRVLTSEERQILQTNVRFIEEASWAIRNFASYWGDNDPTAALALANQAGIVTFFKNHIFSTNVLLSGFSDPGVGQSFVILSKGMQLWDSAVPEFDPEVVVDYMIATNKFDELSSNYVELKTASIIF